MSTITMEVALAAAIGAAREAGALLRAELHRPGGPRGTGGHAEADREAEKLIRGRLLARTPDWTYTGEETGDIDGPGDHRWIVDPNDGTSAFVRGERGSAVSIGLVIRDEPVLGVVYAFSAPDDEGDLIAWAAGCGPITRNGWPSPATNSTRELDRHATVLCGTDADRHWRDYSRVLAPSHFRAMPSIAYRLALVAVGEADAALSLNGPCQWDFAAGQAILRGAGGELVDQSGNPVRYSGGRASVQRCFGGPLGPASELASRSWTTIGTSEVDLRSIHQPARHISDAGRLARAQGCLLGQLAGDSLGSRVEFQTAAQIAARYPGGVRDLRDGGTWNLLAGQPTDDSELALSLARSLVNEGTFDPERVFALYLAWYASKPFDIGDTTRAPLAAAVGLTGAEALARAAAAANRASESNGSLMRVSPLGVFAAGRPDQAAAWARADSALTHPNIVCQEACAAFAAAIAAAVGHGVDATFAYNVALQETERRPDIASPVREALERAKHTTDPGRPGVGWVLLALQNAFYQLFHASSLEEALVATVGLGGDTDTTAAICGALVGAVRGRDAIPTRWRSLVLSCRSATEAGAVHPRDRFFWPIDAMELAESLLAAGTGFTWRRSWPDVREPDLIWRPDPSGLPRLDMTPAVAIASQRAEQPMRQTELTTSVVATRQHGKGKFEPERKSSHDSLRRAYGGVVSDSQGLIALVKPAGGYGGYAWTFPKGGAIKGESPLDTAVREVREEAGVVAEVEWLIPTRFYGSTTETVYLLMRARIKRYTVSVVEP